MDQVPFRVDEVNQLFLGKVRADVACLRSEAGQNVVVGNSVLAESGEEKTVGRRRRFPKVFFSLFFSIRGS